MATCKEPKPEWCAFYKHKGCNKCPGHTFAVADAYKVSAYGWRGDKLGESPGTAPNDATHLQAHFGDRWAADKAEHDAIRKEQLDNWQRFEERWQRQDAQFCAQYHHRGVNGLGRHCPHIVWDDRWPQGKRCKQCLLMQQEVDAGSQPPPVIVQSGAPEQPPQGPQSRQPTQGPQSPGQRGAPQAPGGKPARGGRPGGRR